MAYHVSWGERPDGTYTVTVDHWYFTKTEDRDFDCVCEETGIEHPFQAQMIAESLQRRYRARDCQRSFSFSEIVHGMRMHGPNFPGAYQVKDYAARAEAGKLYPYEWRSLSADVYDMGLQLHREDMARREQMRAEWLAEKKRKNRERMYEGRDD